MPRVFFELRLRVLAICNYSGCFSGAQRSLNFLARAKAKLTNTPSQRGGGRGVFLFLSSLQKQTLPSFPHPLFQLLLEIPNLSTWVSLSSTGQPLSFLSLGSGNNRHVKGQWASPYKAQNLINFIKGGSVYAIWQPGGINHLRMQALSRHQRFPPYILSFYFLPHLILGSTVIRVWFFVWPCEELA